MKPENHRSSYNEKTLRQILFYQISSQALNMGKINSQYGVLVSKYLFICQ